MYSVHCALVQYNLSYCCQVPTSYFGKLHQKHGVQCTLYTGPRMYITTVVRLQKVFSASFTGNMVYVQCRTLFTGPIIAFLPGPGKLFRQVSRKRGCTHTVYRSNFPTVC
jgi:hypothetical protein